MWTTLVCKLDSAVWNFFDSLPFRQDGTNSLQLQGVLLYISWEKQQLCNSRIQTSWINTGSATFFMHRLSAISSSGFSIKETPYNYLMSEAWERNKDFSLSVINIVITSLQIPYEVMVIRFHLCLKTACCICPVLVYLITVQNKAL